jgi:dihydrofolate synthase/folylpolyglutamate synthase
MTTYPDSVRYLYALGNEIRTIKLGLDRIRALLGGLGNPERACRFIHVAGTNGKGSACAMIEAGLRAAGVRTGLYISPHLVEPTERIQIGGVPVSEDLFVEAFDCVHRTAIRLLEEGTLDGHPTYFETVTAMGFLLFRKLAVETVVLEVGLGGRLDATNVVTPELCVITPIDFDHEFYLGHSLESIAAEKAAILKPGRPAVFARQRPEVVGVLAGRVATLGIPITSTSQWEVEDLDLHPRGSRFRAVGPATMRVECPLAGEHQVENALTAIAALHAAGAPPKAIMEGIRGVRWPGRLEPVSSGPEIILDGAHNPAGIRALAAYIERFYTGRRVWLIYGAMRDKSLDEISGILAPLASEIILTAPDSGRALRPEALCHFFDHPCVRIARRLPEALAMLDKASPKDLIFVTGSLFLVGEARALLMGATVRL